MSDYIVLSDCIVLNPETEFKVVTENNDITVDEVSTVITQTETLFNSAIVEQNTDFFLVEKEFFVDFSDGSGTGGRGIADAPIDSKLYGRKNGTWVEVIIDNEPDSYLYTQVELLNQFKQDGLGFGLDPKNKFVTINALISFGIMNDNGGGSYTYTGPVFMVTPPTPLRLQATPTINGVQLSWYEPRLQYTNHYRTQVFRNTVNDRDTATQIYRTGTNTVLDGNVVPETFYYYWIRFVSLTNVVGPFNSTSGLQSGILKSNFVNNILDILNQEITLSQLNEDLRAPIELITATDGIIFQQQELANSIITETANRVAALSAETSARIAAINDEIYAREAGISSVTTSIETNVENLQSQISFNASKTNGSFDTKYDWQFTDGAEGWTTTGGSPVISSGKLRPPFSTTSQSTSPAIVVDGQTYSHVRARIRKVGTPTWDGTLLFKTNLDADWTSAVAVNITEPTFFDGYAVVEWDLSLVTNWILNSITGIRIQLSVISTSSNYYELDWVAIGKIAPGASVAYVKQEITSQTSAIAAEAALRETLAAQLRGSYTGTDINSVTTGILYNERIARATADEALSSQLALLTAGTSNQFDQAKIWYFDTTAESWTGFPSNPTVVNAGWIRPANHASDSRVMSPTGLAVDAVKYPQVRVRVRKVGSPPWAGELFWRKPSDGSFSSPQVMSIAEPVWEDNVGLITFNPEWESLVTIDQIRLDLGTVQTSSDYLEIDWIAIGRPSPGASSAELAAEILARTNADSALASSITSLTTTVAGKATQSSVDSLSSRVTTAEGTITSQGTKLTQIDSQMFTSLINDNPSLIITNPASNLPDGWSVWDMTGLTRYTGAYAYSGGNALQMVCTTGSNAGIQFICNTSKVSNHDFVDVELIFTVTSGSSLSGAGLLFDWFNTTTNFRTSVPLKDILPTFELNKKYVVKYRLQRPPAFTGTFGNYQMWLMGNYPADGLGARSAHTIIYDSVKTVAADASASAISILDSRVTSAEGVNTSQASSLVSLRASLAQNTNAFDVSTWVPGTTGDQGTGTENFWQANTGAGVVNTIVNLPGPFTSTEIQWQAAAGTDNLNGSGGFNAFFLANKLANTRGAVFYLFVKHDGPKAGSNPGAFYFGPPPNRVTDLSNSVQGNPYFGNFAIDSVLSPNEWYLVYGVVQPLGSTAADSGVGGVYQLSTGTKVASFLEFRAHSSFNTTLGEWRSYLFYSNQSGRKVWWARPTLVPADSAPSPWEIMAQDKRLPATATALANLTATVTDSSTGLAATVARTSFLEANLPSGGGNLIPFDTDFTHAPEVTANWVNATRNLAGTSWTPVGYNQIGYTSPGQTESTFDIYSNPIPLVAGKRYGISGYVAGHRCDLQLILYFYNGSNVSVGSLGSGTLAVSSGGQDLVNWTFGGAFGTAPATTVYGRFVLRGNRQTSQSDPYMWLVHPMVAEVTALQTALPRWQPSAGNAIARIASEETARVSADNALSTLITNVTTTVNGHTSTISTQQTSINGLSAQYMVKLDVNGYVSGFGLYNSGSSTSFLINSDKFAVGKPGATGIFPFVVDTTNNRVAMDGAYIKTATITDAKIANLNASKIIAGSITTDKLQVGSVTAKQAANTTTLSAIIENSALPYSFTRNMLTFSCSGSPYLINAVLTVSASGIPNGAVAMSMSAIIYVDGSFSDITQVSVNHSAALIARSSSKSCGFTLPLLGYASNTKATAGNHTISIFITAVFTDANGNNVIGTVFPQTKFDYSISIYCQENKV